MSAIGDRVFIDCVCSRTGKSWTAALEKRTSVCVFVDHYTAEEFESIKKQAAMEAKEARKQEILARWAAQSSGGVPPLPPPSSVELRVAFRQSQLTSADISGFGFQCPYCQEGQYLICVKCGEISCMGDIDQLNRTICVRCNTLLQFGGGNAAEPTVVTVKATEASVKGINREFQKSQQTRLLKGQQ